MRVLLTNDDGIYAKGIEALYESLSREHDVTVVAPETEQSAVGHAITWLNPLRVASVQRNGKFFGYALNGTPADCVKIGITELLRPIPDVVVSGINAGANVGVNLIYSGTVSAATEAAVLGVPGVAVSIDGYKAKDYSGATSFVLKILKHIEAEGLPEGVLLNVNVPNIPAGEIRGARVTHQGSMRTLEGYDRRIDPRGHVYYWLRNSAVKPDTNSFADSQAIAEHFISVTPIHHDLTHYEFLDSLKAWNLG